MPTSLSITCDIVLSVSYITDFSHSGFTLTASSLSYTINLLFRRRSEITHLRLSLNRGSTEPTIRPYSKAIHVWPTIVQVSKFKHPHPRYQSCRQRAFVTTRRFNNHGHTNFVVNRTIAPSKVGFSASRSFVLYKSNWIPE